MNNNNEDIILEGRNITKKYGEIVAIEDVTFKLPRGEVVALLGDNGAGKSTLIKVFSGAHRAVEGKLYLNGKEIEINNPKEAKMYGIETVYQDLALVDCLSIDKNIYLGKEIVKKYGIVFVLQNKAMRKGANDFLAEVGINVKDPKRLVSELSGGQRHAVAISKGAFWTDKILILDEPTGALGVEGTNRILNMILELKKKKLSIILITHNMEHAFMVADRFVILRAGKKIGERKKSETNVDEIVKMITGGIFVKN